MTEHSDTVLVVDDDGMVRDMLHKNLELSGYQVLLATNGEEGLHLAEERRPHIILLDLNMPVMDGIEFLERLNPTIERATSVIVLTGFGTSNDIKKCYQLGIQSFLRKPVNWFELEGIVKKNLELLHYAEKLKQEIEEKNRINGLLINTFNGMAEGIIAMDKYFNIRLISQKACSMLDVTEEEALDKPAASILGAKIAGPSGVLINSDGLNDSKDISTQALSPSGRVVPVLLTVKLLDQTDSNLEKLLFLRDLRAEQNQAFKKEERVVFGDIISGSAKMKDVFDLIENVALSNATVLIQGDSGTGKELVAKEIHARSNRAKYKMHTVNCAAIPTNLLESEFFGHEKGAFTGAHKLKIGRLELADKGTLFLDEIGEIPLALQVKLLRALQEQKFERVGGTTTIDTDVRIMAATNRDLKQMVKQGLFREDLFYRLDVVKINLPPLRERMSDIPLLVSHFIKQLNQREHRSVSELSGNAYQKLFSYAWPGNVRELYHAIEHAFAVSKGDTLKRSDLPEKLRYAQNNKEESNYRPKTEKENIQLALEQTGFHKGKAAALLGISYVTLYRKIKKYEIST